MTCGGAQSKHGIWKCVGCLEMKPKTEFRKWLAPNPKRGKDRHTRCNVCMEKEACEKEVIRKKSLAAVMKPGGKKK